MASCESNLYPNVSQLSPTSKSCSDCDPSPISCSVGLSFSLLCFVRHRLLLFLWCVLRSTSGPDRAAPESYIAELLPHRPPMAMAEAQITILKVIVAGQFFSSCYFKVQLLHTVTLIAGSFTHETEQDMGTNKSID